MLSLFPTLLSFALIAPFIIRLALAFYFLSRSKELFSAQEGVSLLTLRWVGVIAGIFVLVGLYTQLAALVLAVLSLILFFQKGHDVQYVLLFVMSLSLLFLGAGFFAFDLPI